MTNIYENIFLRREEDAMRNICRYLDTNAKLPTVEELVEGEGGETTEQRERCREGNSA